MTTLLIKLFIKNPENVKDNLVRENYGKLGSITGILCNLLLCILKIIAGILTASISIVADGLNNLSDMGSSVITMIGFKLSNKPADRDHPFGHGRMEYMSAFIVAILILLVGFELLGTSVKALFGESELPNFNTATIIILVSSVLVKFWMYCFNRKIGKKIKSEALVATAKDSLNDCIATTVILISVIISITVILPFNLDALMGIFVALFIIYSGIDSAKNTIDQILGMPPEKELIEEIENTILSFPEFAGIHDLIVHNYGPGRQFASVHVEVPHNSDIVKCHEQIDICEKLLFTKLNVSVVIHMDPIDTDDENVSEVRRKMSEALKEIDSELTLHDFRMTPTSDTQTNLIFDVVVPSSLKIPTNELQKEIENKAKNINNTFKCVITYDNDYIGK